MSMISTTPDRILVVDDEPANLKLLDRTLRGQGYKDLALIDDPREVIAQYRARRPDLILLDINMPHLDGYHVMEQLRALEDPLLPPIVILTAQHDRDYLLRALAAGARDFIGKPFDRNELLMRVRNLLDAQLAHRLVHDQKAVLERQVDQRTAELRESEAALHKREQLLQQAMRLGHFGVWVWDVRNDRCLLCSEEQAELFGMTVAEFLHEKGSIRQTAASAPPEEQPAFDAMLLAEPGRTYDVEYRAPTKSGELRYFREIGRTFLDDITGMLCSMGVTQDITATKTTELELRRFASEAQELAQLADAANRAKSEFLATMSHELRTPLNAVIGFSEMLLTFGDRLKDETIKDYHQTILDSGRHLLSLINDILDLAKVESGRFDLSTEEINLADLVSENIAALDVFARRKNVSIVADVQPIVIVSDRRILKQILINLLSNAVKFNKEQGRVAISATPAADTVTIVVSDTGIGLQDDEIARVLQPFVQIESTYNRSQEGTGLGLTLVDRFTKLLGGRLRIKSEIDKGTTISIELPLHGPSALHDEWRDFAI